MAVLATCRTSWLLRIGTELNLKSRERGMRCFKVIAPAADTAAITQHLPSNRSDFQVLPDEDSIKSIGEPADFVLNRVLVRDHGTVPCPHRLVQRELDRAMSLQSPFERINH